MWKIVEVVNRTIPEEQVLLSGGGQILDVIRGPEGSSYRIIVTNKGFLDLVDIGHGKGAYQININGCLFNYQGEGKVHLTFNNDGAFQVTGGTNNLTGYLKPMPTIALSDTYIFHDMMNLKLVPYQNIPDAPGKPPQKIEELGRQFFPFTQYSTLLSYSVYDWTTESYLRMLLFKFFAYSSLVDKPLDQATIADIIWTSNLPHFTPHDGDFMHSFMMVPADHKEDVRRQLSEQHNRLHTFCEVENNLFSAALYSLPRTSVFRVPQLYSGQPVIANLGFDCFAAEFQECPTNTGPVGVPMKMPFQEALQTIFKVGNTITLKGVMSFTEYKDYAMKYCNGILIVLAPPPGAVIWDKANYITPLSDDPTKNEYSFVPGSQFHIQKVEQETISGKEVYVFNVMSIV